MTCQNPNKKNFASSIKKQKEICANSSYRDDEKTLHEFGNSDQNLVYQANNIAENIHVQSNNDVIYGYNIQSEQENFVDLHESTLSCK